MLFNLKKTSLIVAGLLASQLSFAGFYLNDLPPQNSNSVKSKVLSPSNAPSSVSPKTSADEVAQEGGEAKPTPKSKREWRKRLKSESEAAAATEVVPAKKLINFTLDENDSFLSVAVGRWCAESNGECRMIKWKSDLDSPLEAGGVFVAESAKDAIKQLLDNISKTTGHSFVLDTHYQNNVWIVSDKLN